MPLMHYLREAAFEPTAIEAMTAAFEAVCKSLQLRKRDDPVVHVVARKIIDIARSGERDPQRIHDLALAEFKAPGSSGD